MDHYRKLKEAGYIGNDRGQRKNDYGDGGIFYGFFYAVELKLCYTKEKNGSFNQKKTSKGYHNTES